MIVVAGEALIDIVVDADGDTTEAVGGAALNVAVGLARLDTPTLLVTQTGHDERGGRIVEHVTASGAEIVTGPTRSGRTSTATAVLDPHGVASYRFDVEWTLATQELPHCDALHVGGLGTLLEPGRDSVLDLVDQAYARDVVVSYDPNIRPDLLEDRSQLWRDVEALAERCTVVKLSDADIDLLHPGADPADIAHSLLSGERTELVVVTRGWDGASAYTKGAGLSLPAKPVEVVDSVGAGDAFVAGMMTALFELDALSGYGAGMPRDEQGLAKVLGAAMEVAGLTCARRGAQPPMRAELPAGWPG